MTDSSVAELSRRVSEVHGMKQRQFAEMAAANAGLRADATSWDTKEATGAAAYVFVYLRVECYLTFGDGTKLHFLGQGGVIGLGATGSLGGSASFNVDPKSLKGADGITFQAASIGVGIGGFQVTWFHNGKYIGHGEFYGLGVQLGTPGGGAGTFS